MNAEGLARALGGRRAGKGWEARCPAHADKNPSLSIDEGEKGVLIHCHAGCSQDAVIGALKTRGMWGIAPERNGHDPSHMADPVHPQLGKPSMVFRYYEAGGELIGAVCRFETSQGKTIRPAVAVRGVWNWSGFAKPHPLYQLPSIFTHKDRPVLVVEGEKTADAARELISGFVVTTWPHGAKAVQDANWEPLRGRDVVLWPDADEPGLQAMRTVASRLDGVAASIRTVRLPELPKGWDLADDIPLRLDIDRLIADAPDADAERLAALGGINAAQLVVKHFAEPRWAIPGLVPEGLMFLAGRPKGGKSFMVLDWLLAVSRGEMALGTIQCDSGPALYLALEDPERRVKGRMLAQLQGAPAPAQFDIFTKWRPADAGGLDDLRLWLRAHRGARLVAIDTFAKIRGKRDQSRGVYDDDYKAVSEFKAIADEFSVAMVLLHHTKKDGSEDAITSVSGTYGLTGSADTIGVLKRQPRESVATFEILGRDVEQQEIAIQFDRDTGQWLRLGSADDFRKTENRRTVLRALVDGGAMSARDIAGVTGGKPGNVKVTLSRMHKAGEVGYEAGKYFVADQSGNSSYRRYT